MGSRAERISGWATLISVGDMLSRMHVAPHYFSVVKYRCGPTAMGIPPVRYAALPTGGHPPLPHITPGKPDRQNAVIWDSLANNGNLALPAFPGYGPNTEIVMKIYL